MGLMLSRMIGMILGFKNGSELIMTAFAGTAGVFLVMASLATVIKRDLSGMGKFLFVGVLVLFVGSIINVFIGSTAGMMAISVAAIGIFSAYMLYDLKQIMDGGETNYISATLALYLDLFNVFQSLLALLGIMGGERDLCRTRKASPSLPHTKGLLREAFCMSGIIICAKRTQLLPGPADNLLKMTMPNLPRTFAILLLPTLLAGCKLVEIPGLGPDPRTAAKEAKAKAIGGGGGPSPPGVGGGGPLT